MVHQIINNRYRVFVESFLVACVIFIIGFSLGYFTESLRTERIVKQYSSDVIEGLDLKIQESAYRILNTEQCEAAIKQHFLFADKIYEVGLELEKYEEANQITDRLLLEKKKYVLLKAELWINTLLLREKCGVPKHTVVYFYSSDPSNSIKVAQQKVLSNILKDLKEEKGNNFVLLPLAGDLQLMSIELQMKAFNITELPAILIDEKYVFYGYQKKEDLEKYIS